MGLEEPASLTVGQTSEQPWTLFFFNIYSYLFVSGLNCGIQGHQSSLCPVRSFSYSIWDQVPQPGIEPGTP